MSTCHDRLTEVVRFSRKCASVCGADIFDPDFHVSWLTWVVVISITIFFVLSGYTIYMGFIVQGDWTVILQALCMAGSAVAGACKLFLAINRRDDYKNLMGRVEFIYLEYERKHAAYQEVLNTVLNHMTKLWRVSSFTYAVGVITLLSVPMYYLFVYNKKIFVMQFIIPGIDPTTDSGHLITITAHTICITFGAFGNFAGDMFFYTLILQVTMLKNILRVKFEDMNKVLLDANDHTNTLPMLLNAIKWHQDYTTYTKTVSDMYFTVTFVQIFTSTGSIGMTVFITFTIDWPAGYAYLLYSIIILYTYCGLGTVTEMANDDLCDLIYNVCLWYELPVAQQKMLVLMLVKAQNPTLLTVGDIMPLSVTTALSMSKTIYSFMMMLFNFAEN